MSSPSRLKIGCALGSNDDVEIAGRAAVGTGVAFAGETDALTVAGSGLDANFERLGLRHRAFAVAGGAGRQILAGTMAAGTLDVELHPSAGLRDLSGAVAFGTLSGSLEKALTVAIRADIVARDVQAHHAAADRRPERNVDLIFQIGSGLRALFGCSGTVASPEDPEEDVAEAAAASTAAALAAASGVVDEIRKIEAAEIEVNPLAAIRLAAGEAPGKSSSACRTAAGACVSFCRGGIDVVGVEANLVVNLALLGIAEDVVGFGERFELLFRSLVARD